MHSGRTDNIACGEHQQHACQQRTHPLTLPRLAPQPPLSLWQSRACAGSDILSPGSTARQSITTGARQEPDSPDSPDTCQSTVPDSPDSMVGPHLDTEHVRPLSGGVRHVKQNPTARQPDSPTVAEQPDSSRQSSTVADSSTVRALVP